MDTLSVDAAADRAPTPAVARDRTRLFLDTLGRPLAPEASEPAVLGVSGLVINTLRRGADTHTMDPTAHLDSIEMAVHDSSPTLHRNARPRPE